jgi:hypothetical protein
VCALFGFVNMSEEMYARCVDNNHRLSSGIRTGRPFIIVINSLGCDLTDSGPIKQWARGVFIDGNSILTTECFDMCGLGRP